MTGPRIPLLDRASHRAAALILQAWPDGARLPDAADLIAGVAAYLAWVDALPTLTG